MAKALTQIAVKGAKPAPYRVEIPDGGCTGLYLVIQPSGVKSWALRYRFDGTPKKLTLGRADREDALSLASARKAAIDARARLEQGTDPALEKQATKAAAKQATVLRATNTLTGLSEQFLELYAKPRTRSRTYHQSQDVLRRLVQRAWPNRTVHEIRRRDVIDLIEKITQRNGAQMADKTLAVLGRFYGWLIARDVIDISPCQGVERPIRNSPRDRILTDSEIVALWNACAERGSAGQGVRLLLLTGCRLSEVIGARWSEIDAAEMLWKLPRERVKNGKAHAVPLASQAWGIIAAQPRFSGCDLIFTNDGRRPVGGFSRLKRALDDSIESAAPWVVHDLRRTFASGLQRLTVRVEVIESCLNHRSGTFRGIVGVYQRHDYLDERRAALQRWADHVAQLVSGEKRAIVVPMRERRQ
jgi:integrase